MIRMLNVFIDGASKGNPGTGGVGFIVREDSNNSIVLQGSRKIGRATNNQAEYSALIIVLKKIKKLKNLGNFKLKIHSDSELLVKHINDEYKIRSSNLVDYYLEAKSLLQYFNYTIVHIPRNQNTIADALANRSLR